MLLLPRLPALKEWAYAGFTFMWIAATVAHYLVADGKSLLPVALLGIWPFRRDAPGGSPQSARAMIAPRDDSDTRPARTVGYS